MYVLGYSLSQHWEVRAGITYLTNWAGESKGSYGDSEGFQNASVLSLLPFFHRDKSHHSPDGDTSRSGNGIHFV